MKLKKTLFILLIIMTVLLFGNAFSAFAQENDTGIIDTKAFNHLERPAVIFDHDDHNENAGLDDNCAVCHHVYDGKKLVKDESSEDQKCSECHSLTGSDKNPIPLKMAFHNKCIQCHFKSGKGPVLCGECHIRK